MKNETIIEYRTKEQFEQIIESIYNGNHTQSAKMCVKYGFYAQDIVNMYNDYYDDYQWYDPIRFISVIETATQIRINGERS